MASDRKGCFSAEKKNSVKLKIWISGLVLPQIFRISVSHAPRDYPCPFRIFDLSDFVDYFLQCMKDGCYVKSSPLSHISAATRQDSASAGSREPGAKTTGSYAPESVRRPRPTPTDKMFWILFSRYVDGWRNLLHGLNPDVLRWHRLGFRLYWRWKSRRPGPGQPAMDKFLRKLIRDTQASNIGWGAPRIHGKLLKLGVEVSQATVSKYILRDCVDYYHSCRTHLSLSKDPPDSRAVESAGDVNIVALPRVGGLHHRYTRVAA